MLTLDALDVRRAWETRARVRVDDIVTTVGGHGSAFVPRLEIERWGEVSVGIELLHDEPGLTTVDQRAIVYSTPSLEARFYALTIAGGGHECAIHWPRTPATNTLRFAVDTNAEILPQGLLPHILPDGSSHERSPWGGYNYRPAWAGNSFAFYHPSARGDYSRCGGQNYRGGKVGHLHRHWAIDAVGHRVWCAGTLSRGVLTITVPWDFLQSAIYPVLVDPTFGYLTHGASTDDAGGTLLVGWCKAFTTPASNGSLDSVTCYCNGTGTSEFDPSIYSDAASAPVNRLAFLDTGGTAITTIAEYTTALVYGSLVSGTQYWLGLSTATGNLTWRYDAGTNELKYRDTGTGNWDATAVVTGTASERISIWGNFTASGGGRSTKNIRSFPLGMALGMSLGIPDVYSAPMARHRSGLYVPERMAA